MLRTVTIANTNKLKEALEFEEKLDLESQYKLSYLLLSLITRSYKEDCVLHISPDFVKHSFSFAFIDENHQIKFNGGIILHGMEESFSIRLGDHPPISWSIHT